MEVSTVDLKRFVCGLKVRALALACITKLSLASIASAQVAQPIVAIHDSELTRAMETMPATGATPTGPGTTGFQWWPTDWHYFVMPEAVKEALRSDGTPFAVVGDTNISAGILLTNGQPRYPILISLASEAIQDNEIAQLTNYVAAGGFLFVGSSAFTRNPNGTSRGDFAIASAMGVHQSSSGLTNWGQNNTFTKQVDHQLTAQFPIGAVTNRLPASSEEIPWGISPAHVSILPHDVWQVQATGATVLGTGDTSPYLLVRPYGKGYFIYCAAFQPLIGNGGFAPGMYSYMVFRKAIEWAFASLNTPVARLSPWPFQYDAAMMVRHDLENFTNEIAGIEASAQVEFTNGVKGDYYFCTGTLRDDASPAYNTNSLVASLRRAVTNYGATIGPHNGGLRNPNNPSLIRGQYDYWHWGPDEALDVTPPGYPSGKAYASASISNSFKDIESWLTGITNGVRGWVGCYFNATRDDSYDLQVQLGIKIAGDQKISPFPHWTFSTKTPGVRYPLLSEPVSDWFVGGLVAQSLEPWHPPGVHTTQTLHDAIDYYYSIGALINIYSHTLSTGLGDAGQLTPEYINYCVNTNLHPRLWKANAFGVYQWWLQRSNAQVTTSFSSSGGENIASLAINGAKDPNTSVEILLPGTNSIYCGLQVLTNGTLASGNSYRLNGQSVKVLVGTTVTNVVIAYSILGTGAPAFSQNFDSVTAPALPTGWTTSSSGAESNWATETSNRDTAPNAVSVPDPGNIGLSDLVSPPIALAAGLAQFSFRNNYDLETGAGTDGFDGGVLEIKIGTNSFTDILTAGGTFASGGYNSIIDTGFSNPLAGRQAWSGTSAGFITTMVNLPAAAGGQTIQFRWRCGTDDSNGRTGWSIDSISITNRACLCCSATNNPPVLPVLANRTVAALTTLVVTNSAIDPDVPLQSLSYQLLGAPAGAGIDANGIITWTPNAAQGPSTNIIVTVVTDTGSPPLSATNSFTVVVTPANQAPILPTQSNLTIAELSALVVTNTAFDPDGPANGLTYSLLNPPAGAGVSSSGVITWTPSEAQGPGSFTITTRVVDSGTPPLSATNSFVVVVTEVNIAPTLPLQADRTIAELTTLRVTNTASDSDIPANSLTYALLAAPAGAAISSAGVITWTPTEAQGPSTNLFTTRVADNGTPSLSATNTFTVVVNEVNTAPVLPAQTNRSVIELTTLVVTNSATDSDIPTNSLAYVLVNPPAGATIDTNGIISWTPTAAQGPGTNVLTTVVTDNGIPPLSATNSFTVFVIDTNTPPVITAQPTSRTNNAGTTATFNVSANGAGLNYQWFKGTATIASATTATLTLNSVSNTDAGSYQVVVTNNYGSVTSGVATLTIISPPVITAQPSNRTNNVGTTATFSVTVTGTSPVFQWMKNGSINLVNGGNVSGANSATLTLSSVVLSDAGTYSVLVTNAAGSVTSSSATLTVVNTNIPPVILFSDNFTRGTDPGPLTPWVAEAGNWTVTGGAMVTGTNPLQNYAFSYITNSWTNYSVQARVRFSSTTGYGGGIGGRLNPGSGGHYAAWLYPENSPAGPAALEIIRFQDWFGFEYTNTVQQVLQRVFLPSVGTNWHSLRLDFQANQINVYYDSNIVASASDAEPYPYLTGGIAIGSYTDAIQYNMLVDDVVVNALPPALIPVNDTYTVGQGATLNVAAPGVLANDYSGVLTNLTSVRVSGPYRGTLTLNPNGSFTYVPSNTVSGVDSFTYMVNDGSSNSIPATVGIDITPAGNIFFDNFTRTTTSNTLSPWVTGIGIWTVTNGVMTGSASSVNDYSDAYVPGNLTDFSIQATFQLPANAWACGLSGRLDPISGARYVANVYPENSPLGPGRSLRIIKFHQWGNWSFTPMILVSLPAVGTSAHTLKLNFQGNQITAFFDGTQVATVADNNFDGIAPYTSGAFGAHMYMDSFYQAAFDNVTVTSLVPTNHAPVLTAQANRTVAALTTMLVTNTATDSDVPAQALAYQLVSPPAGASINSSGVITWTPTNGQGPSTNIITTIVTDNGTPPLSATNAFTVTVIITNIPPSITTQPASRTNVAGTTATFNVSATGTALTYQWLKNVTNVLANSGNVSGANSASLTLSNVAAADAGNYSVVITNIAGSVTSSLASLTVAVSNGPTTLFSDDFTRGTDPGPLTPWVVQSGTWTVTGGLLRGGPNTLHTYADLYVTNSWTNYSVQAQVRFPAGAYGGGIGACVNRATGAHYGAWIYPEGSAGGSSVLKLIKFPTWTTWAYQGASFTPMAQVNLASVGTNWHTLQLNCLSNQLTVILDGVQMISVTDVEVTPLLTGGVSMDFWTDAAAYTMSVDNVSVTSLSSGPGPLFARPPAQPVPPVIQSFQIVDGVAYITWDAEIGSKYKLQFSEALNGADWKDVQSDIIAVDATAIASHNIGSSPQGFYRVVLLP